MELNIFKNIRVGFNIDKFMKKKTLILITALSFAAAASAQEAKTMYVMKNGAVAYQSVVSDIDSIIFYNPIDPLTYDEGVIIDGKKWATRNVDAPGTFAATPEDPGMFYQWNSTTGWSATDPGDGIPIDGWNSGWSPSTWETTNDVCPAGWRVPTEAELQSLIDAGSVWTTTPVNGCVFGSGDNTIFLPAAGYRISGDGTLYLRGNYGFCWSSTVLDSSTYAYHLYFGSAAQDTIIATKSDGFPVRCIAEY